MNTLTTDYARCAEVLRGSGSSFALPIRLLPFQKRQSTTALYAFCRRADDIVDNTHDPLAARVALEGIEQSLAAGLAGCRSEDPVLRALVDTVRRYAIPPALLYDILAGVRMDLDRQTYDTFANLEEYCRRVASAVGLAAIHIWGFRGAEALPAAHSCGLAFQLTNILRDIPEDLRRGRIYLPEEDFQPADARVTICGWARSTQAFPAWRPLSWLARRVFTNSRRLLIRLSQPMDAWCFERCTVSIVHCLQRLAAPGQPFSRPASGLAGRL